VVKICCNYLEFLEKKVNIIFNKLKEYGLKRTNTIKNRSKFKRRRKLELRIGSTIYL
jgi:hypothetical protein